jgi:hypothetical protein
MCSEYVLRPESKQPRIYPLLAFEKWVLPSPIPLALSRADSLGPHLQNQDRQNQDRQSQDRQSQDRQSQDGPSRVKNGIGKALLKKRSEAADSDLNQLLAFEKVDPATADSLGAFAGRFTRPHLPSQD